MTDDTLNIERFDPTVAELTALVDKTKNLTTVDLKDKEQIAVVRENRIALKNARISIQKKGKELREDAIKFQKAVIVKEKELIAIVEPEEERLEKIESEAKELALREERAKTLPERKERIATAIDGSPTEIEIMTDDQILNIDDNQFDAYINRLTAIKLENVRIENERVAQAERERIEAEQAEREKAEAEKRAEEQAKIDAENARIKAEQDAKDAELKAQADKIKAEQDARDAELKAEADRIEREKLDLEHKKQLAEVEEKARIEAEQKAKAEADAKAEAERIENERIEAEKKAEQEKLEKQNAYKEFLASCGYTDETKAEFKIMQNETHVIVYKKVGEFAK
jgi:hypothetical protein